MASLCRTAHLSWFMTYTYFCTNTHTHNQLTRRQQEWSGVDRRGCTRSVPVALLSGRLTSLMWANRRQRGLYHRKTYCRHHCKKERGGRIRRRVLCYITVKKPLPPTLCLFAARCQPHTGSPTVFNNSRAPLKRRQMGQQWWSRRCHCEPAERK